MFQVLAIRQVLAVLAVLRLERVLAGPGRGVASFTASINVWATSTHWHNS